MPWFAISVLRASRVCKDVASRLTAGHGMGPEADLPTLFDHLVGARVSVFKKAINFTLLSADAKPP